MARNAQVLILELLKPLAAGNNLAVYSSPYKGKYEFMQLEPIHALVKDNLQDVNALILGSLRSKASVINDLGHYIIQSGGKRLRPLIVLLMAKACGYQGQDHIKLAAVIEFIHTATLLHDDVVDNSDLRRGQKTANSVWGNEAAVLVGDFLYSKAFQILVNVGDLRVMQVLADATNTMAEGEALQLIERHNPETTEGGYLNVIRSKTAKLFEAAAQIGALLGNISPTIEAAALQYGLHLGTAFQLMDDILDYQASTELTGKSLGNDLAEGKVTLPLIYILQNGKPNEIRLLREAIQTGGHEYLPAIQEMIRSNGALDYTKQHASTEIEKANKLLVKIPTSPYRDALQALTKFAIHRDH